VESVASLKRKVTDNAVQGKKRPSNDCSIIDLEEEAAQLGRSIWFGQGEGSS
jgi:hypothetical protein